MKKYFLPLLLLFSSACEDGVVTGDRSGYYSLNYSDSYSGAADQSPGDRYNELIENPFINVSDAPVSTFSIDADGGSYSNVRRFLSEGAIPPPAAVRTEELINYFPLDYAEDDNGHPISLNGEVSACPWDAGHKLIRVGIKGRSVPREALPPSNLVLLIDVSGSMSTSDKLELLKSGFLLLVDKLSSSDRIAIVTYAGSAGVVLPATAGNDKTKITAAINSLGSRGSTAGAEGIITAYAIAEKNFIEGGNNRVILGTDGDFNVGISTQEELVKLIEAERDKGVFLTAIGVGRGNLNEGMLEQVADHGNGTYEYIDDINQAKKVFVDEYSKFYPAAKDVKVQVEFNPLLVASYRLLGYENRLLEDEDFEDDNKDAGEISIGQNVTALYEINPSSGASAFRADPAFTIKFRYKLPAQDTSIPLSLRVFDEGRSFTEASESMRFTASVAGFGMLLRHSTYKGSLSYDEVLKWTTAAMTFDPFGRRAGFAAVVRRAAQLPGS
jgi:Ca-activated chloride channel family protein